MLAILGAIGAGSATSFVLSNPDLSTVLPGFAAVLGLSALSLIFTVVPFLGILSGEVILELVGPVGPVRAALIPATTLVLAGLVGERLGVGRSFWWVRHSVGAEWLVGFGGQPLLDCACAGLGAAATDAGLRVAGMAELVQADGQVSLIDGEASDTDSDTLHSESHPHPPRTASRVRQALPFLPLAAFALVVFAGPLLPTLPFKARHPSPSSPNFRYPPVKVACVVPPTLAERHRRQKASQGSVEEWLRESRVVASRGAKILGWSEGAVRLEAGDGGRPDGEGWDALGRSEQQFLKQVAEVADKHKVSSSFQESKSSFNRIGRPQTYIAATYLLPASPPHPRHKEYNIVTLVGPTLSTANTPNIIFSTTKHLPVPLIESYTAISRTAPAFLSSPSFLPVAALPIPHRPSTPSPHLTPFQSVAISSFTCLDIARSFPLHPAALSPALILNPSSTPLRSLAESQLDLARTRAIEHRAFILRCDSADGVGGLVAPDGSTRVVKIGEEGWASWEFDVDAERAERGTVLEWLSASVGGGGEWAWVLLLAVATLGGGGGEARTSALVGVWGLTWDGLGRSREWAARLWDRLFARQGILVDVS